MAETLQELFVDELRDLYDAEKQLVRALPKMAKAASDSELENGFREHLEQTKGQVQRLEQVFELLGTRAKSKPCAGMKGLVEEGQELIEELDDEILDSALTGAGRKVEHYEMMAYESARALAKMLRLTEAVGLLEQNLREEVETDKKLAQISKRLLTEAGRQKPEPPEETPRSGGRSGSSGTSKKSGGGAAKSRRSNGSRGKSNGSRGNSNAGGRHSSNITFDHDEIRRWAEERGAHPACVRGTGGKGDTGMIRLDFPGFTGADSLEEISWDDFFEKFDDNNLALVYQETTAEGEKSNFNKLVKREAGSGSKSRSGR